MKKIILVSLLILLFPSVVSGFWFFGKDSEGSELQSEIDEKWQDYFLSDPFFFSAKNFWRAWDFPVLRDSKVLSPSSSRFALDLEDQKDTLVASVEIGDFLPSEITIEIQNGRWLKITGRKDQESEKKDQNRKYYYRERQQNNFSRQIYLPHKVDKDTTKARFTDKVLTITMPKKSADEEKNDIVEIEVQKE